MLRLMLALRPEGHMFHQVTRAQLGFSWDRTQGAGPSHVSWPLWCGHNCMASASATGTCRTCSSHARGRVTVV